MANGIEPLSLLTGGLVHASVHMRFEHHIDERVYADLVLQDRFCRVLHLAHRRRTSECPARAGTITGVHIQVIKDILSVAF
eukprot:7503335-Pyramimonas_sp.AAC.1